MHHIKFEKNWFSGLRKEDILSLHDFMHIHCAGTKADNPRGQFFLLLLKGFATIYILCELQPLVFNTFLENDVSTFSPYKCIQTQF